MTGLYERFLDLQCPPAGGYTGFFLDDHDYVLARDHEGRPAFFVRHGYSGQGQNQTYKLEGISAILHYEAIVTIDCHIVSGVFALIRCTSDDDVVRRYFLELCDALSRLVGPNPKAAQVDESINTFVRMFALRRAPSKRPMIGLLGELLFIDQHADSAACVKAWHVSANDSIDFVFPTRALEVKSTATSRRFHILTYDQASGLPGRQLLFMSVQVMPVAHGMSGRQLLQRVVAQCGADLAAAMRVWEVATETLGFEIQSFLDLVFAYEASVESMQFFDATTIPAIRGALPLGVSGVQFVSDFSQVTQVANFIRGEILSTTAEFIT